MFKWGHLTFTGTFNTTQLVKYRCVASRSYICKLRLFKINCLSMLFLLPLPVNVMRGGFWILPPEFKQTRSFIQRGEWHGRTVAWEGIGTRWGASGRGLEHGVIRFGRQCQADEIKGYANRGTERIQEFFIVFTLPDDFSYGKEDKKNVITLLRHVGRLLEIITALDARVTQLLDNLRKRGFNHFTQCCKLNGRLNAMKLRSKQKKCTLNLPEF